MLCSLVISIFGSDVIISNIKERLLTYNKVRFRMVQGEVVEIRFKRGFRNGSARDRSEHAGTIRQGQRTKWCFR